MTPLTEAGKEESSEVECRESKWMSRVGGGGVNRTGRRSREKKL